MKSFFRTFQRTQNICRKRRRNLMEGIKKKGKYKNVFLGQILNTTHSTNTTDSGYI